MTNEYIEETTERTSGAGSNNVRVRQRRVFMGTPGGRIVDLLYMFAGLINTILFIRILLSLLGANPANAFAKMIYNISRPLVAPFYGLFAGTSTYNGISRFEVETLVAIIVYTLLIWIIARFIIAMRTDETA